MAARLRLGLVGVGRMGRNYARIFADHPEVELDLVDPPLGLLRAHEHWDGAIVAAPTGLHHALAMPLLAAGLPVLIEKPLAATPAEGEALARFDGCFVGHVERFNPAASAICTSPRFVQAERIAVWVDRGIDVDVVLDLMVHDLDLFLHRSPGASVVDVRANGVRVATQDIDLAQARVELDSGAVGTFTASRVSRRQSRTWRVFDADGTYTSIDLGARRAERVTWERGGDAPGPREARVDVPDHNALEQQVLAFAGRLRGEPAPGLATARQALDALRLAWRVREAIRAAHERDPAP